MYNRPYSTEEIKQKFPPEKAKQLLNDPVHKWRAETGIELIHKEPSLQELERIWANWQEMTPEQKKISEVKSAEFFGVNNEQNYFKILAKFKKQN